MKKTPTIWLFATILTGLFWIGCGSEKSLSPVDESINETMALSKQAQNPNATTLSLTILQDGIPVPNAVVSVSKSISGRSPHYQWSGTTDAQGNAIIEISNSTKTSGYYTARATTASGTTIGTWSSLVINEGQGCSYVCRAGKPARTVWYIKADDTPSNANIHGRIYHSFAEMASVSAPGDEIRILPSTNALEGGITLKDGQKLIGVNASNLPTITSTQSGVPAITLANNNEVANIHIVDTNQGNGILGTDVQNAYIHNCLFTNVGGSSITINIVTPGRLSHGHVIEDCTITGSPAQGGNGTSGIALTTTQNGGDLKARIERVTINDLSGSGLRSGITLRNNAQPGTAGGHLEALLRDVIVENVIAERLIWAFSYGGTQNVTLERCRIANNAGKNGLHLTFQPVTVGPFGPFPAHHSQYKIEQCDITGTANGILLSPFPRTDSDVTIDLGGGSLGSQGGNRLFNNNVDLDMGAYRASATSNWWGSDLTPIITLGAGVPAISTTPILTIDPRP